MQLFGYPGQKRMASVHQPSVFEHIMGLEEGRSVEEVNGAAEDVLVHGLIWETQLKAIPDFIGQPTTCTNINNNIPTTN